MICASNRFYSGNHCHALLLCCCWILMCNTTISFPSIWILRECAQTLSTSTCKTHICCIIKSPGKAEIYSTHLNFTVQNLKEKYNKHKCVCFCVGGYCILMPPFSEVDKTAPCKFVCTAIELFTSCRKHKLVNEHKLLRFSHIKNTHLLGGTMKN